MHVLNANKEIDGCLLVLGFWIYFCVYQFCLRGETDLKKYLSIMVEMLKLKYVTLLENLMK